MAEYRTNVCKPLTAIWRRKEYAHAESDAYLSLHRYSNSKAEILGKLLRARVLISKSLCSEERRIRYLQNTFKMWYQNIYPYCNKMTHTAINYLQIENLFTKILQKHYKNYNKKNLMLLNNNVRKVLRNRRSRKTQKLNIKKRLIFSGRLRLLI